MEFLIKQANKYKTEVEQICKDFTTRHNLQFFGYLRCYKNKRCFVLSTHPQVYDYLVSQELPLNAPVDQREIEDKKFYYLLPDISNYAKAIHDVGLYFNLYHPLDLFFRNEQYYEMFCYGINQNNLCKINYYLNNLVHFDNFAKFFKEKAQRIINYINHNPCYLSDKLFDPVKNLILDDKLVVTDKGEIAKKNDKYYLISLPNETIKITKREYDCLECLLDGTTAQETADQLALSRRTVEGYLDIVREKTFSRNKLELISKMKEFIGNCYMQLK